jgi:hypothetical protein
VIHEPTVESAEEGRELSEVLCFEGLGGLLRDVGGTAQFRFYTAGQGFLPHRKGEAIGGGLERFEGLVTLGLDLPLEAGCKEAFDLCDVSRRFLEFVCGELVSQWTAP